MSILGKIVGEENVGDFGLIIMALIFSISAILGGCYHDCVKMKLEIEKLKHSTNVYNEKAVTDGR